MLLFHYHNGLNTDKHKTGRVKKKLAHKQNKSILTQLFFFFFLASWSFKLPTLDTLVRLLRLEMLSHEFWRRIRRSGNQESSASKHRQMCRKRERTKINWYKSKPFMLSGLFKAPCMTAWASSFLLFRDSIVSRSSNSSESCTNI